MRKKIVADATRSVLLILFLVCLRSLSFAQDTIPELWGVRVHDLAKVMSPTAIDLLEKQLKAVEDSTSDQISVLVITKLPDITIEEYALKVAEKWKLGTAKKDNGVLILVAVDDHKMRIEVGQGLEGRLTDAQCNRIIRNEMAPSFRKGNYDEGITDAVNAILTTISGEYKNDPADDGNLSITERIFMGLFVFGILGLFTSICLFSTGCASWGLYVFLLPFYALFPSGIVGVPAGLVILALYVIGVPVSKAMIARSPWGKKKIAAWNSRSVSTGASSSGSSWSSSGSSWSSSDSGSSFSGGGGSFGGGGSSGSW